MTPHLLFSVIIPTFNRADKLDRCLHSLADQNCKNFEVLVCDDGSTDNTAQVVQKHLQNGLDIRYFFNTNWGGPAYPRNIGIKNARGTWLCFLDADDWWHADKLEVVLQYCTEENDLIYHPCRLYRNNTKTNRSLMGRQLRMPVFEDLFVNGNCIVNSSVCARKALIVEAGLFSEDKTLIAVEDLDLWLRCARLSEKFKYIPVILGAYDVGSDNITAHDGRQLKRIEALFSRHKEFLYSSEKVKKAEVNWSYNRGVLFLKMKKYKEAQDELRKALGSNNLAVRAKSLILLIKSIFS